MKNCAWCEEATGEILVPGKRGALVHPSCDRFRGTRRTFLIGTLFAAVAAALPLPDLLKPAAAAVDGGGYVITTVMPPAMDYDSFFTMTLEKYLPALQTNLSKPPAIAEYMQKELRKHPMFDKATVEFSPTCPRDRIHLVHNYKFGPDDEV
jgi:hypothetical protein